MCNNHHIELKKGGAENVQSLLQNLNISVSVKSFSMMRSVGYIVVIPDNF